MRLGVQVGGVLVEWGRWWVCRLRGWRGAYVGGVAWACGQGGRASGLLRVIERVLGVLVGVPVVGRAGGRDGWMAWVHERTNGWHRKVEGKCEQKETKKS